MQLQELLARLSPLSVQGPTDRPIHQVTQDSRAAGEGDVFVAIQGRSVDGHLYVSALNCAAVVVEQDVHPLPGVTCIRVPDSRVALAELAAAEARDPSEQLAIVGITGTNGKTTTCWILEAILEAAGWPAGVIGTTGNRVRGVETPTQFTTPLPRQWQGLLREMVDAGCKVVAAEVSSIGLDARRVDATRFSVGVFTHLGRDHLDYHGSMQSYVEAKARLFSELVIPGGDAVLPVTDPTNGSIADACRQLSVRTFGLEAGDVTVRDVDFGPNTTQGTLVADGQALAFELGLIGRHNLLNALAAVGAALALGVDLEAIISGLGRVDVVPGRLEPVAGTGPTVFVDYAHTPDALEAVLEALREVSRAGVGVVFGCGGDRDRGKRPEMARAACAGADWVVATTDNPRSEDPAAILRDLEPGLEVDARIEVDREQAIRMAVLELAQEDDLVLIAGKGHEQYQEVHGERLDFDDRVVAARALRERGER